MYSTKWCCYVQMRTVTPTTQYILVPLYCHMLFEVATVCDVLKGIMGIFILLQFGFILLTVWFM